MPEIRPFGNNKDFWYGFYCAEFQVQAERFEKHVVSVFEFDCGETPDIDFLRFEAMTEGYYAKVKNNTPPFKHDLKYLAKETGLVAVMSDVQISFITDLDPLNIEARYPDYQNKIAQYLTDANTKTILSRTKEFVQWIKLKI
jgi:hypothetical protein